MTQSPWTNSPATASESDSTGTRGGVSVPVMVLALLLATGLGGGAAWWVQASRVLAKEQERAAASAELATLASRVQNAETAAAAATQELKKAQAVADTAGKQAADTAAQLETARRDAAGVRTERDEARATLAATKSELEKMRADDLDPGALPQIDLASVFAGSKQYRTVVDYRLAGSAAIPGLDRAETEKMLAAAMQAEGLSVVGQSTFRIAVFVSIGPEKPRPIGVMMLVLRTVKIPGESGSREVAVWGQQRTSSANDVEAAGQVRGLLEDLCQEFASKSGAAAAPPASAPVPVHPAPAAPAPANAPAP